MKKTMIFLVVLSLFLVACDNNEQTTISSFEECVAAGNPVMESYPMQCTTEDGMIFVEKIDEPPVSDDDIIVGGDEDEHGCIGSAGYVWCEHTQKCIRPWEEDCPGLEDREPIIGGDKDEHGCIGSAGYLWCEEKQKCLRTWEEECPSLQPDEEFCGTSTEAECEVDTDCKIGGCSGQVCGSSPESDDIVTTCEYRECYNNEKYNLACGCNEGKCSWA